MTPEGKVQAYLKKRVLETGGEFRKLKWDGRRNAPDTLVWWVNDYAYFVEVKRPGEDATPAQKREHKRLPFPTFVIDNEAGVDAFVDAERA